MPEVTAETPDRPRLDWREVVAAWRRLIPEEKQRIRLECAARHARLVQEGKIDDDWYDRYCRESSTVLPSQGGRKDEQQLPRYPRIQLPGLAQGSRCLAATAITALSGA